MEKLQAQQQDIYPDGLRLTIQRRLKGWRTEHARALVFSHSSAPANATPIDAETILTAM